MKRRSIYDWKALLLFVCILIPLSPLFYLASRRGAVGLATIVAACVLIAAVVSERLCSLFFHHVLSSTGATLWSSRGNAGQHARDSLLAILVAALSAAAAAFAGKVAGTVLVALAALSFAVFAFSVLIGSRILCLHSNHLQYGSFLYAYADLESFDLRDTQLDLEVGGERIHCSINESLESSDRLRDLIAERCS